jgi:iron complex outermembrane receptor protein
MSDIDFTETGGSGGRAPGGAGPAPIRTRMGALAGLSLALLVPMAGQGQDPGGALSLDSPNPYKKLTIEELLSLDITSVSKRPEKIMEAPAAIYVITPQDIHSSGFTCLPEVFRMAPGVHVGQINGSSWAISARGFNSEYAKKMLVLIDERAIYSPSYAGVFWESHDLPLYDIDRIEVIRGPGGTLWGANAINGVINVMTKSSRDTLGGQADAWVGTEEQGGSVRYGGALGDNAWFRAFVKYANREDSIALDGRTRFDDAWYSLRYGFRADWEASPDDTLTLQGEIGNVRGERPFPVPTLVPPSTPEVDGHHNWDEGFFLARWKHTLSNRSDWNLKLYYNRISLNDLTIGMVLNTLDADFRHHVWLGDSHEIVWGLEVKSVADNAANTSTVSFTPDSQRNDVYSAFVQDDIHLVPDRLALTLGSKFEYNGFTGFEYQPSVRLRWTPDEQQTAWAAVSRSVRTPDRLERDIRANFTASPTLGPPLLVSAFGDADVASEKLIAYEIGYRARPDRRVFLDAAAFYNVYTDLSVLGRGTPYLELAPPPPHFTAPLPFSNIMDGCTFGGEVTATWQPLDPWTLYASYSRLHMNLHAKEPLGSNDPTGVAPINQATLRSLLHLPYDLSLDNSFYTVGHLRSMDVPGYLRVDAKVAWRPLQDLEICLVGQNLFQRHHKEFEGFWTNAEVERNVYVGVTWKF